MSSAKLTIIGLYTYMQSQYNEDLFEHLYIPDGIDRESLINNIMLRGGEFEVLYGNPKFMKDAIKVWSNKWQRTFDKWVAVLDMDYNPLENYDRNDTSHDSTVGHDTATGQNKVSAFDSNQMQDDTASATNSDTTLANDHTARSHGNIGVTTSQQMLQQELDVQRFNIIDNITDLFLAEFVIPLY